MSTHLDGPVHALPAVRGADRPLPTAREVAGWAVLWSVFGSALAVAVGRSVGAQPVFGALTTAFHLGVTFPLLMAAALLAVSAVAAALVAAVGLAARVVRPGRRTGAAALCGELLRRGSVVLPGYASAWRRLHLAWVKGAVYGAAATAAVLGALVAGGWVPLNAG